MLIKTVIGKFQECVCVCGWWMLPWFSHKAVYVSCVTSYPLHVKPLVIHNLITSRRPLPPLCFKTLLPWMFTFCAFLTFCLVWERRSVLPYLTLFSLFLWLTCLTLPAMFFYCCDLLTCLAWFLPEILYSCGFIWDVLLLTRAKHNALPFYLDQNSKMKTGRYTCTYMLCGLFLFFLKCLSRNKRRLPNRPLVSFYFEIIAKCLILTVIFNQVLGF